MSGSWVRWLKQRRRETGEVGPRPRRYGPRRKLATLGISRPTVRTSTRSNLFRETESHRPLRTLRAHRDPLAVTRRVSPAVQLRRMPELLPPCRVLGRWAIMKTASDELQVDTLAGSRDGTRGRSVGSQQTVQRGLHAGSIPLHRRFGTLMAVSALRAHRHTVLEAAAGPKFRLPIPPSGFDSSEAREGRRRVRRRFPQCAPPG